ncbi:TPA: hypothetical protein DDX46_02755 [Candidatus Saccharibacteria bacterium]|nr:MAG: RdgB/HAM1 family non-canonical purine NTP pyrophosphatase, dITP/XTP pyrophosphatase [Candidatus Saccharibacteria bacterium GW2011_GWC2_44_17]OGL33376.1 MAG: hypothetical protein A3E20_00455 [Candidatus Saccharibacteria bacterium RIFCSPHIGHO2_12_FULL_47_16]HBH77646.1 hypothetical protein [Candidatus Saccharibacteria bacterium]
MTETINFATTNNRKIVEARKALSGYDIGVIAIAVDIDEIQHQDPAEITKAKARAAYEVTHEPVVVQDTSWSIPALGGFPGGYMKDVSSWWQPDDWLKIMDGKDRTIICLEHIAYFDGQNMQHFEASYEGKFAREPRGVKGNSIEKTVCLYGNKTLAERHDRGDVASAAEGLVHWSHFAEWFTSAR